MIYFKSPGDFAVHLRRIQADVDQAMLVSLRKAAEIVQEEARDEIGTYQGDAGSYFASWQTLANSTAREKERLGYAPPDNPLLRTGELRASIQFTIEGHTAVVGSDDEVAVYQEFGTATIPARSFLGRAAYVKSEWIVNMIGGRVVWALRGLPKERND